MLYTRVKFEHLKSGESWTYDVRVPTIPRSAVQYALMKNDIENVLTLEDVFALERQEAVYNGGYRLSWTKVEK